MLYGTVLRILVTILSAFLSPSSRTLGAPDPSSCQVTEKPAQQQQSNDSTVNAIPFVNTGRDFISQVNLMLAADLYFGPVTAYTMNAEDLQNFHRRNLRLFISCIRPGAVVFVYSSFVKIFFDHIFPQIQVPIVLITGGSDDATHWSNHSKIVHWYGTNCEGSFDRKFFTCIPLGLSDTEVWGPSSIPALRNVSFSHQRDASKKYDVVVAFSTNSHPLRPVIREMFCGDAASSALHSNTPYSFTNARNATSLCITFKLATQETFEILAASKFIVSPHGHGLDCYRTWEALYLGAIPIVMTSSLDSLYEDLPVLIVKNWNDVTPKLLNLTYMKMHSNSSFHYNKLSAESWFSAFSSHGYKRFDYSYSNYSSYFAQALVRLGLKDGDLIKADQKLVYVIANGTKCAIPSLQVFVKHGWDFSQVKRVSEMDLIDISDGPDVV